MNTPLERYFSKIVLINLARRTDQLHHARNELQMLGITDFEIFDAHDAPKDDEGKPNGNMGCTASHRGVLELIGHHGWLRTLILEDDFTRRSLFRPVDAATPYLGNVQELFGRWISEVPADWKMLYLGGHYGEDPIARVSEHVLRCRLMLTTSSYAITYAHARRLAPYVSGIGPIEHLISRFHGEGNAYVFEPRFFVQYTNHSDLQGRVMENTTCMEDRGHTNRFPWKPKTRLAT